jgi:hypothetical protein
MPLPRRDRSFARPDRDRRAALGPKIALTRPDGKAVVMAWAVAAGEELVPRPDSKRVPTLLRVPLAFEIRTDAPPEPACAVRGFG